MLKYINGVPNAPEAIGPYSQAVVCENMVYVSGQVPIHPETGEIVEGGIEAQADQVMRNLLAILGFLNIDFSHAVKTTIYLTDMKNFQIVNAVYSKWMGSLRPARATVEVAGLPRGALVEIDCVAVLEPANQLEFGHSNVEGLSEMEQGGYSAAGNKTCRTDKSC